MDCTGSMGPHINAAKSIILEVAEYMENMKPSVKIRLGFCGYRDHNNGADRLQRFPFTDSYVHFRKDLSNVTARSGQDRDTPEDVLGGLNEAITQMSWSGEFRFMFHIGDNPPHGRRYSNLDDNYPDGEPHGLTAESVLREMESKRIFYFFGKVTNNTDKMIDIFHSIIGEFPVHDLPATVNPEELVKKLFEATCSTIETAISLKE